MGELDTGSEHVLGRVEDGVAVLTLHRPERRNAFTDGMIAALGRTLEAVDADDAVGCVVLTGSGAAFSSGGDVTGMTGEGGPAPTFEAEARRRQQRQRVSAGRLWSMRTPSIAAIPGPAAGAGLALALACDLRYAAERAVLVTAFARVGLSGDYGASWFLTRLLGPARAKELLFFSPRLSAAEAAELGLVNEVLADDGFEAAVTERARRLASGPRLAHGMMKENVHRALSADLLDAMDVEAVNQERMRRTEDNREAAKAFLDKRPPAFRGR